MARCADDFFVLNGTGRSPQVRGSTEDLLDPLPVGLSSDPAFSFQLHSLLPEIASDTEDDFNTEA
jgi:hypothetical protein